MEKRVRQLNIGAEERDKRTSAARRLNKNENNRLRHQYEHFQGNHEVITIEIEQEMKKIQHELNGIREISGYEEYERTGEQPVVSASKNSIKRKRKQSQRSRLIIQTSTKTNENSRKRLTRDESVNNKVRFNNIVNEDTAVGLVTRNRKTKNGLLRNLSTAPAKKSMPQIATTGQPRISRSGLVIKKNDEKLPQIRTSGKGDKRPLLELDSVSEAREQARKRLIGGASEISKDEESEQVNINDDDDDVEAYMYVPPDGRKRTVYLIPPLEELLKEASKARYLRMPKRSFSDEQEDPERELSVDEIFNK